MYRSIFEACICKGSPGYSKVESGRKTIVCWTKTWSGAVVPFSQPLEILCCDSKSLGKEPQESGH